MLAIGQFIKPGEDGTDALQWLAEHNDGTLIFPPPADLRQRYDHLSQASHPAREFVDLRGHRNQPGRGLAPL